MKRKEGEEEKVRDEDVQEGRAGGRIGGGEGGVSLQVIKTPSLDLRQVKDFWPIKCYPLDLTT